MVVFAICSSFAYGQFYKLEMGLAAGPTFKRLYGNKFIDNEFSMGYSYGIFLNYPLTEHFSLYTRFAYDQKGTRSTIILTDDLGNELGESYVDLNMDYFSLPLLARFTWGQKLKYYVQAGPYGSYLKKAVEKTEDNGTFQGLEFDRTDNYKKMDWGITAGVGLMYPLTKHIMLSLEARNNIGLVNISELPVIGDKSIKTHTPNLLLGISYVPDF